MAFLFSDATPSDQASLDIFRGKWISSFPAELGFEAGYIDHFNDPRVTWADQIFDLSGKSIVELGPLEAYNTYQFEKAGAAEVLSIEASEENFLKCLVVKNVLDMKSKFIHGDFEKFIPGKKYDILWASGVLYHLVRPVELLDLICGWTDRILLWTQYYDGSVLLDGHLGLTNFDRRNDRFQNYHGRTIRLHWRSYLSVDQNGAFSGGSESFSYWMELEDILHVLGRNGFCKIEMGVNNPFHPPGPACFFMASK